jgi:hypothetical protein
MRVRLRDEPGEGAAAGVRSNSAAAPMTRRAMRTASEGTRKTFHRAQRLGRRSAEQVCRDQSNAPT